MAWPKPVYQNGRAESTTNARCIVGVPGRLAYQGAFFLHRAHGKKRCESARRRRWLRKLPADHRDAQKKALTFHLLTGETLCLHAMDVRKTKRKNPTRGQR